jgi:zinc transporter
MAAADKTAIASATPADDPRGLVWEFHFGPDGMMAAAVVEGGWTWRNYSLTDARGRNSIEAAEEAPRPARESLLAMPGTLHLDQDGDWFHGTVPDIHHQSYTEAKEIGHFRFAFCDAALITARRQPLQAVDDVRRLVEQRKRPFRTPGALVEAIIVISLERMAAELVRIGHDLDSIEDSIVGDAWHRERERLTAARRNLVFIHRQVASVTGLFRHAEHVGAADLSGPVADMVGRLSHRAVALLHDSEQAQSRARLLQDELMAKLSAESNRLLYVLSVLTAVLLPMTIISGLFGMNVGGLPFVENRAGFWIISVASVVIAAGVFLSVNRIGRH